MTIQEAKFILRSHRPGTDDDRDPVFAAALAMAEKDPALQAWLDNERDLDAAIGSKLRAIEPGPDLVDEILAGARAGRARTESRRAVWLAAAAAAVLLAVGALVWRPSTPGAAESLARIALSDTLDPGSPHAGVPGELEELLAGPAAGGLRSRVARLPSFERLQDIGCRSLTVGGREVFELCIGPGHRFHLYIGSSDGSAGDGPTLAWVENSGAAAVSWIEGDRVFALVSTLGRAAVEQML